jgi:hypothetical protein
MPAAGVEKTPRGLSVFLTDTADWSIGGRLLLSLFHTLAPFRDF